MEDVVKVFCKCLRTSRGVHRSGVSSMKFQMEQIDRD